MQKLSEEAKKTHRKVNWKTVDYIDLCRYDKGFECAVEVKVKKDGFPLGKKGDILRFCVSEYGIQRLLWDSLNGIVDITASLRYPFMYFAFAIGLKSRPITSTKSAGEESAVSCAGATTERWWQDGY